METKFVYFSPGDLKGPGGVSLDDKALSVYVYSFAYALLCCRFKWIYL